MKVIQIPVESLTFPQATVAARPLPSDKSKDWAQFKEFKQDISFRGVQNLFSVRAEGDKFCVIDGSRRAYAVQTLWNEGDSATRQRYAEGISVQVQEISDVEALGAQIAGNRHVNKQPDASLAKALYKYIVMNPNKPFSEIARECGYSEGRLNDILKINSLPDIAKEALNQGRMTSGNAIQLTKLPIDVVNDQWVEKAMTLKGDQFTAEVNQALNEIKKVARLGAEAKPAEFVPTARLLKKEDIASLYEQAKYAYESDQSDYNRGYKEALAKVFQLDEASIAQAKADWDKKQADAEELKKKRAAEREAKKMEDSVKFIQEHGGSVELPAQAETQN